VQNRNVVGGNCLTHGLEQGHSHKLRQKLHDQKGTGFAVVPGVANSEPKQVPAIVKPKSARPVHDEWGLYDPEQAGLEAVIRRLRASREESSDSTGTSLAPRTARRRSDDVSR
jgi:hypothetical protein